MEKIAVSVVIPTVGRVEVLPTVLTALSFQTHQIDEVIILDEAKTPVMENYVVNQSLDVLSLQGVRVKVLRNRKPEGIGSARLALVEEARNEMVLMVDDDVVLLPSCVEHLLAGVNGFNWAVPTCRLIPADFTSDGYIDTEIVDPMDPRVTVFTSKYPWFVPYFRYQPGYRVALSYAGTQAILLRRSTFLKHNRDLGSLGKLPREDSVMTKRMGLGVFISEAETLHYEHKSQVGRANWSKSVHYRLHEAAARDPEAFVQLMSLGGTK